MNPEASSSIPPPVTATSRLGEQMRLYDVIDRAFAEFNDFTFRGSHQVNNHTRTSTAGRALRRIILWYGRRPPAEILLEQTDFSTIEIGFWIQAGQYGQVPGAEAVFLRLHQAIHAYCHYVDEYTLEGLAHDRVQMDIIFDQRTSRGEFDV